MNRREAAIKNIAETAKFKALLTCAVILTVYLKRLGIELSANCVESERADWPRRLRDAGGESWRLTHTGFAFVRRLRLNQNWHVLSEPVHKMNIYLKIKNDLYAMQCAKLQLQERSNLRMKISKEKYTRFCQKRLVDPEHEEDPRWTDIFERFWCNEGEDCDSNDKGSERTHKVPSDLCLSVQNLQFQGNVVQRRRPRTGFKYKITPNSQKHRMFVKHIVEDCDQQDASRSSELSDYFDDYSKYFSKNQLSRPSSGKSSTVLYSLSNKSKENKATQVDLRVAESRKKQKSDIKKKKIYKTNVKSSTIDDNIKVDCTEDTKVAFHKNGKRKSLTLSRAESPSTIQIIRVDVVCNNGSSSTASDYEDIKKHSCDETKIDDKIQLTRVKKSCYVNKYKLTNTVKTLDENITGGKVTLLCKTFKLTDRPLIESSQK